MMVKDKYRYEMRKGHDELMTKRSRWSVRSNRISWGNEKQVKGKRRGKRGSFGSEI